MGHSILMLQNDFFLAREHHDAALEAIKRLDPQIAYPSGSESHFAFVTDALYRQADTLFEAMRVWRWLPDFDDEGNLIELDFLGEKLGDDAILFQALAPFIRDGSAIQMAGEDGRVWRWFFVNGKVQEQEGKITFSPPER